MLAQAIFLEIEAIYPARSSAVVYLQKCSQLQLQLKANIFTCLLLDSVLGLLSRLSVVSIVYVTMNGSELRL